jgi:predicted nucleotidyltransferase
MRILEQHINDINKLCAIHKVKELYAFGSVLTEKFDSDSDVDFVVDFYPIDVSLYTDNYYDLKFSLQKILNRQIDLLEEKAIKNPYFRQAIDQQRQLIYGH